MASFTVQSAQYKTEKKINNAPMHIYTLSVLDANNQVIACEILQRPSSPAPAPGMVIEGEMKPSSNPQFPPTLKRAQQASGGGGGGSFGPEDIARITRSHSQEMALRFISAAGGLPGGAQSLQDKEKVQEHLGLVKRLSDWFDKDVGAAGKAAGGGQQQAQPAQQQAPPPQQPPAQQAPPAQAPAQQPDPDDDIPF